MARSGCPSRSSWRGTPSATTVSTSAAGRPAAAGRGATSREQGARPTRVAVLERPGGRAAGAAAVVATTGKAGRELFTIADRPQHIYQVGSMGCASAMGLGVALNTQRPVVVLDGDGAALMKMGVLATIGAQAPANLVHVVLDNGVHDSTGGQATVSPIVDFADVALACGYASGAGCDSVAGWSGRWRPRWPRRDPTWFTRGLRRARWRSWGGRRSPRRGRAAVSEFLGATPSR